MTIHHRRLKLVEFSLDGNNFECQLRNWTVANNTDDGERLYTFCPTGEDREEADDDYALELEFYADWRSAGISEFLWQNDQQIVAFNIEHHPDIPAEHRRISGQVKVKAPPIGGEIRTTEMTEVTLPIIGRPTNVAVGV